MQRVVSALAIVSVFLVLAGCPAPVTPSPQPGEPPPGEEPTRINGTVVDRVSGAPVAGMSVEFAGSRSVTDAGGRFSLELGAGAQESALGLHGEGYRFLFVEKLELDPGRDQDVVVPVQLSDPSEYVDRVTLSGEIRLASGTEIPDGSSVILSIYSTTGAAWGPAALSYEGQYSLSAPLACADCLVVAVVEPAGGLPFAAMAARVDLSGTGTVRQDLAEPAGGYVEAEAAPERAGNRAMAFFSTPYGPVPACFQGDVLTSVWTFSTGTSEVLPVFNPFGWEKALWIQIGDDPSFPGLPQHLKTFMSVSAAGPLAGAIVLPSLDRGLGPSGGADPDSLACADAAISLASVPGACLYEFTLRAENAGGQVLGTIWATNSLVRLPGWMLKDLGGRTIHVSFEAFDCGALPFDPAFLAGAWPSMQLAVGTVKGDVLSAPYEKILTVPAAGSVVIGID